MAAKIIPLHPSSAPRSHQACIGSRTDAQLPKLTRVATNNNATPSKIVRIPRIAVFDVSPHLAQRTLPRSILD
jgi:hypothetical protein